MGGIYGCGCKEVYVIYRIAAVNGKLHNFIDFRIFLDFYSTIYCLQTVKILAPNSVLFRF